MTSFLRGCKFEQRSLPPSLARSWIERVAQTMRPIDHDSMNILCTAGLWFLSLACQADGPVELRLESPTDYQVIQRQNAQEGQVLVSGIFAAPSNDRLAIDALQARFIGKPGLGGKLDEQWQALPFDPRVSAFRCTVSVPAGGWY